jgi:diacylglycerol kinase (ATP)
MRVLNDGYFMKPTRYIDSVNCAIEGILYAAKTQKHMRNHFIVALLVLVSVMFLRVSALEFTLLAISVSFVLFAELMNTAIELLVDLVSPEYHTLAKLAKDVAAGAVLIAAIGAAVMGYLILSSYFFPFYKEVLGFMGNSSEMGILLSLLIVVIVVVILKAIAGRGTPLQGGIPSGHSAIAFSIATIVSTHTKDPASSILTLVMAVLVSNSRIALRLHTMREVVLGGILGSAITLIIFYLVKGLW